MMKKLEESQEKLTALQNEQMRLLQMQRKAENKLAQMTLLKKKLERNQSLANSNNSNVNLAFAYGLIGGGQNLPAASTAANDFSNFAAGSSPREMNSASASRIQSGLNCDLNNHIEDVRDNFDEVNIESDEPEDEIYDLLRISKLKNLQRKKHRMNDMLREIEEQQALREKRAELIERLLMQQTNGQRRYEADGSEEDEMRVNQLISSVSQQNNSNIKLLDSCDSSTPLASKIKQLHEAETRLKQVEALMKSIEEMENNIKDVENEKFAAEERKLLNDSRKSITARTEKQPRNSTEPKTSRNQQSVRNPQKNTSMTRNVDVVQENLAFNYNNNTPGNKDNRNVFVEENNSSSFHNLFFRTLRTNFESTLSLFERQFTEESYTNNDQILQLMMMQNFQIMQQQQMILMWLQQKQQQQQQAQQYYDFESMPSNGSLLADFNDQHPTNSMRRFNRETQQLPTTLNNQVVPGVRANNYWDNFKSHSRQNKLSLSNNSINNIQTVNKSNENQLINQNQPTTLQGLSNSLNCSLNESSGNQEVVANNQNSLSSVRQNPKSANSSQGQLHSQEHIEKQQNLPVNDLIHLKQLGSQLESNNNIASLYSMLEKLLENDEKCDIKCVARKKSTNLSVVKNEEEENSQQENEEGAVGGMGISNTSNYHEDDENRCTSQQQAISTRSHLALHVSPSSGAIRKKPRNQEILELNSRSEVSEISTGLGTTEAVRPLMPADGRPSENHLLLNTTNNKSAQTGHILLIRPPATGAPGINELEENSSVSSEDDDDLVEADQTALIDPTNSETETLTANGHSSVTVVQDNLRVKDEATSMENTVYEDEEETLIGNRHNESGIRLSGDGEQGL